MVPRLTSEYTTRRTLIIFFVLLGMIIFLGRWLFTGPETTAVDDSIWQVNINAEVATTADKTLLHSFRPRIEPHHNLVSQRYYHPGFRSVTFKSANKREFRLRATTTGQANFTAEYHVVISRSPRIAASTNQVLTPEQRQGFLQATENIPLTSPSLINLDNYLRDKVYTKQLLVEKIFHYTSDLVATEQARYDNINDVIKANKATTLGRARLMVALSRLNNIPARLATGFILEESTPAKLHHWVELYDEETGWQAYGPEKGFAGKVPNNYLVFSYITDKLVSLEHGKLLSLNFSVSEDTELLEVFSFEREKQLLDILDLRRLDFETRATLVKMLILPLCVLLTAFIRHVIGLYPYGTFTAPLLALAMVYTDVHVTLIVFGIVLLIALLGRSVLPKSLSRAPRLSLIFTFVSLSLVFTVSLLNYFAIDANSNVILIPIIILVAIVDRFYSYMDKAGKGAALIRLGVTVLIAGFCVPVLQSDQLGLLLLRYPELHFLTLALVLLASAYAGKKLTDNRYLRLLGENRPAKKSTGENPDDAS